MNSILSVLGIVLKMTGGKKLLFHYLKEHNEVRLGTETLSGLCHVFRQAGLPARCRECPLPDLNPEKNLYVIKSGYHFLVVTALRDDNITYTSGHGTKTVRVDEFKRYFTGETIVIPKDAKAGLQDKPEFFQWLIISAGPFALMASALMLFAWRSVGIIGEKALLHAGFLFLYAVGFLFSILLFSRQYGMLTGLTSSFCFKTAGGRKDCDSVLASKGALLFGDISWSDVGIVYFFSMLLIALIFPFQHNTLAYIFSSLLTAPYVVYSIWYQAKVVHAWCFMCLVIQALFVGQLVLSVLCYLSGSSFTFIDFWTICLTILSATSLFLIFRRLLKSRVIYKYAAVRYESLRFEHMPEQLYLSDTMEPVEGDRIIINPEAEQIVTIVFNFLCAPCMRKIEQITQLLQRNDGEIGIEFIFFTRQEELKENIPLLLYFTSLYRRDQHAFLAELGEYARSYPSGRSHFAARWDSAAEIDNRLKSILINHLTWGKQHGIIATPTFLHNYRFVKNDYSLHDIVYVLECMEKKL